MLLVSYRIAGNFDIFDAFQPDRQNLTCQIFKSVQCLVKDSDHPSKYFAPNICRVIVSVKISRYTVSVDHVMKISQL